MIASPVALTSTTLANGTVGILYSATVSATGGSTPYNWSVSGLPAGLTYAVSSDTKTLTLSGTPAVGTAGLNNVAFTITDAAGAAISPTPTLVLTIGAAPVAVIPVAISTSSLSSGTENSIYLTTLSASGGTAPFRWAVTGALPVGLTFDTTGKLSGTPATGTIGAYSPTFTATDSKNASSQKNLSLTIKAASISSPSTTCPTVKNTKNGSAKITEVEDHYILVGKTKVAISKCTQLTYDKGATKLKVGETVNWTGSSIGGVITASNVTITP